MSEWKRENFDVRSQNAKTSVKIGENGKICHISVSEMEMKPIWTEVSGNLHSEESVLNVDYAFEIMMEIDIETFKAMLKRIKESDPEYYEKGVELLQNKKEQLIKEVEEKYSL